LSSKLNLLKNILELEVKKNYQDKSVIGGLDKYLANLSNQIEHAVPKSKSLSNLKQNIMPDIVYSKMNEQERREWINHVLQLVDCIESTNHKSDLSTTNKPLYKSSPRAIINSQSDTKTESSNRNTDLNSKVLDSSLFQVKGISENVLKIFNKLGLNTIRDLLYYFPRRHIDYSQRAFVKSLVIGAENTIIANVWESRAVLLGRRRSAEATVGDETGNVRIIWFNQPYMAKALKTGQKVVISGHVTLFSGMPVFESPEWELYEEKDLIHTGRWIPVYSLTQGLGQRQMRRIMKPAIDQWSGYLQDFLPPELKNKLKLLTLSEAIRQAHYPQNDQTKNESRRRLAFDELLLLQLGVLDKKRLWQENKSGLPIEINQPVLNLFLNSLPFKLTTGQSKAMTEILEDLKKNQPMSRLLQGEVGSGKTIIAAAALILTISNGYQAAMMAPTEILAQQHFSTLRRLFSQVGKEEGEENCFTFTGFLSKPLTIALLTGDIKDSAKGKVHKLISSGEVDLIIGTHSLIQKNLSFNKLGLIIVDEQHRFGVEQRSALSQKGNNPHILVMTATPIPRTLALTLYGDLDLSVINELPPGRKQIKTKWLKPEQRESAYGFMRKQIHEGRQAFIICPFVEESEIVQAKAAIQEYERLAYEIFPDLRLGLLHGRLSAKEKEKVMQSFNSGDLNILVSTPVVEVGIDVPNATVMLIESADRFGLSQLHQFRGRIGRGQEQSYCMLLADKPSDVGKKRLDLIEKIHNGFILAEEDLKLRGPGEFFGTRQSGLPDLKMARLSDISILELARNEAINLFRDDPGLKNPQYILLSRELSRVWGNNISLQN
jgi:ATP-dependent DNA helicase RecG